MHRWNTHLWLMSILLAFSMLWAGFVATSWAAAGPSQPRSKPAGRDVSATQTPHRSGDVATPAPRGVPDRKLFPPEDPEPLHKLRADKLALDKMIDILESKNQWFEQKLIGPTLLFSAGCGTTLLGIVVISVFPNMAVGGLIFGSPAAWLVVGALVAVVGFGLVVGGGVWHAPIHKKQRPVRENLAELKVRRKHLLRLMARRTARSDASTLHLPAVASPRLRVAF